MTPDPAPELLPDGLGVIVTAEAWREDGLDPDALCRRAAAAVRAELGAPEPRALAVAFADDAEVAALNARFRGVDGPTNVLAFPAAVAHVDEGREPGPLGDVVLAYETVRREAESLGLTLAARAAHMVVHGCLHLYGYDHKTDDEAVTMELLETRSLARIGYGDPYGDRDG